MPIKNVFTFFLILCLCGCMAITTSSYNTPIVNTDTSTISINIQETNLEDKKIGVTGIVIGKIEFKKSYKYVGDISKQTPDYMVKIRTTNNPNREYRKRSTCQDISMFSLFLIPCYEATDVIFNITIDQTSTGQTENFEYKTTVRNYYHMILVIPTIFQGMYNLEDWQEDIADHLLNEINTRVIKMSNNG